MRIFLLSLLALFAIAACAPQPMRVTEDGERVPAIYRLSDGDTGRVQLRMRDAVNALREENGLRPLELDSRLNAAAATHSRDMAAQQRPWHFGSDGSSPLERVRRAGYNGRMLGELISETYETELETLTAWMSEARTRNIILDSRARDMGFAFYQQDNGKLWWTMVTGAPETRSGSETDSPNAS